MITVAFGEPTFSWPGRDLDPLSRSASVDATRAAVCSLMGATLHDRT
jgi:hypothetical protein